MWPRYATPEHVSKGFHFLSLLYIHVYCCLFHNSKKIESTYEILVIKTNEIMKISWKRRTVKHYCKCSDPGSERQILNVLSQRRLWLLTTKYAWTGGNNRSKVQETAEWGEGFRGKDGKDNRKSGQQEWRKMRCSKRRYTEKAGRKERKLTWNRNKTLHGNQFLYELAFLN